MDSTREMDTPSESFSIDEELNQTTVGNSVAGKTDSTNEGFSFSIDEDLNQNFISASLELPTSASNTVLNGGKGVKTLKLTKLGPIETDGSIQPLNEFLSRSQLNESSSESNYSHRIPAFSKLLSTKTQSWKNWSGVEKVTHISTFNGLSSYYVTPREGHFQRNKVYQHTPAVRDLLSPQHSTKNRQGGDNNKVFISAFNGLSSLQVQPKKRKTERSASKQFYPGSGGWLATQSQSDVLESVPLPRSLPTTSSGHKDMDTEELLQQATMQITEQDMRIREQEKQIADLLCKVDEVVNTMTDQQRETQETSSRVQEIEQSITMLGGEPPLDSWSDN